MDTSQHVWRYLIAVAVVNLWDPILAHVSLDGSSRAITFFEGSAGESGCEGAGAAHVVDMLGDHTTVDDRVEAVADDRMRMADNPQGMCEGEEEDSGVCEPSKHRGLAGAGIGASKCGTVG